MRYSDIVFVVLDCRFRNRRIAETVRREKIAKLNLFCCRQAFNLLHIFDNHKSSLIKTHDYCLRPLKAT